MMNNLDIPKKSKLNSIAVEWIKENLFPIKSRSNIESSYGLKHRFEFATGLYMNNAEFKYAMREAGFEPLDENEKNWCYKISRRSPGLLWVSLGCKRPNNYQRDLREYKVKDWKPIKVNYEKEENN